MNTVSATLTVLFDDPFWIGLYERMEGGRYEVCKVTFGAEPKEERVYRFFLENRFSLRFSPALAAEKRTEAHPNPKRMQREASRQLLCTGVGTKAQQALQLQHEENKLARHTRSREQREREAELRFCQRQEKRREKHRGR